MRNPGFLFTAALMVLLSAPTMAQTAITYQGQLQDASGPFDETVGMEFRLYDSLEDGNQVGSTIIFSAVEVSDGLFQVELDFGDVFDTSPLYLEVEVAGNILTPRQLVTAAPTAVSALNLSSAGVAELDDRYWKLGGNAGTTPGSDFIGTSDSTPLALQVNGSRALELGVPTDDGASNEAGGNVVAGHPNNMVNNDAVGVVIGGGGASPSFENKVGGNYATVGGGIRNTASGLAATVGGGAFNTASGAYSTVGGGNGNTASGFKASVPGGEENTAAGNYSFAAGREAEASHEGTFVWADSGTIDFISSGPDQFLIRASNGVAINNNDPNGNALRVNGTVQIDTLGAGSDTDLCLNSSGIVSACGTSSARYKKDISDLASPGELIAQLRAVSYRWKKDNRPDIGLIAEEVAEVEPRLATFDDDGEVRGVKYRHLTAVLVAAWQEQRAEQEERTAEQEARLAELESENAELKAQLAEQHEATAERLAALEAMLLEDRRVAEER